MFIHFFTTNVRVFVCWCLLVCGYCFCVGYDCVVRVVIWLFFLSDGDLVALRIYDVVGVSLVLMFDPFLFWGFPVCFVLFSVVFLLTVLLNGVFAVVSRVFVGAIVVSLDFMSRVCVAGFRGFPRITGIYSRVCVLSVSWFPSNHLG